MHSGGKEVAELSRRYRWCCVQGQVAVTEEKVTDGDYVASDIGVFRRNLAPWSYFVVLLAVFCMTFSKIWCVHETSLVQYK